MAKGCLGSVSSLDGQSSDDTVQVGTSDHKVDTRYDMILLIV